MTCLYTLYNNKVRVTYRRLKDHLHCPRRLIGNKDPSTPSTTQHNNTASLTKGPSTPSAYDEDLSTSTTLHPSAKDLSTPSTSTTQRQQRLTYTVNFDDTTTQHRRLKDRLHRRLNDTTSVTKDLSTPSTSTTKTNEAINRPSAKTQSKSHATHTLRE